MPVVIPVLAIGTFLMGTTEFVVAGLLSEVARDFGISVAHAGLTVTVFAAGMIVGAPGTAVLTLRVPRRWTLTVAIVVFALGHVVIALATDFTLMLVARAVTALATGAFWAIGSLAAAQAAGPAASGRALGLVLGGGMLANVVGVPLGSFAGQIVGWRGTFWVLAVLAAAVAVLVARLVPRAPDDEPTPSLRSELGALRSRRLWLTLSTCTLVTGGVLSIYSFISPILTDQAGLPVGSVPLVLMGFGVASLIGTVLGGRLGDERPYRTAFITTGLALIAAAGIWVFSAQTPAMLVMFALLGLVGLSANPILVSLAVKFGGEAPTLAAALPTALFNVGTAIGTWLTGVALDSALGPIAPAVVGTIFGVLVLVPLTLLFALDRQRTSAHAPSTP
jgi:predicted MFS family arabinose efflux permease